MKIDGTGGKFDDRVGKSAIVLQEVKLERITLVVSIQAKSSSVATGVGSGVDKVRGGVIGQTDRAKGAKSCLRRGQLARVEVNGSWER